MTNRSIRSNVLAREWAAAGVGSYDRNGFALNFRLCRRARSQQPSGGAVLTARDTTKYDHGSYGIYCPFTIHLKKGWTDQTLSRAIHRLCLKCAKERPIRNEREALYHLLEPMSRDVLDSLVIAGEAAGRTVNYDEMTSEDVEVYTQLVTTQGA